MYCTVLPEGSRSVPCPSLFTCLFQFWMGTCALVVDAGWTMSQASHVESGR